MTQKKKNLDNWIFFEDESMNLREKSRLLRFSIL